MAPSVTATPLGQGTKTHWHRRPNRGASHGAGFFLRIVLGGSQAAPTHPLPTLTQIKRPSEGRRLAQDSRAKQRSMENPSLSTPPPFSPGSRMQLRPTFGSTKGPQLHPETVRPSLPAAAIRCRILPSRLFCTQPFTTSLRQQKNCGLAISCWEHR